MEVTLQPVRALGVDAAILFSDLLLPLEPLGIPFDFQAGEGPVIETPDPIPRRHRAAARLRAARGAGDGARGDPPAAPRAGRPAHRLRRARPSPSPPTPSRAASPRTSPSPSGSCTRTPPRGTRCARGCSQGGRRLPAWRRSRPASRRCSSSTPGWARSTRPTTASSSLPHVRAIFDRVRAGVPVHPLRDGHRPPAGRAARGGRRRDRRGLAHAARRRLGAHRRGPRRSRGTSIPPRCSRPRERLLARVDDVLRRAGGRPGHVFNLGHGILPRTAGRAT